MDNADDFQGDTHATRSAQAVEPSPASCRAIVGETPEDWRRLLEDASVFLDLPTDLPRPAQQSRKTSRTSFVANEATLQRLRQRCGSDTSVQAIFLSAFALLLARYSTQHDLLVGCLHANAEGAAAPAVLRYVIDDIQGFAEIARDTQCALDRAKARPQVSVLQLAGILGHEGSTSHAPLVQAVCVIGNAPADTADLVADYDLALCIDPQRPRGDFIYATDLFGPATIERMCGHLLTLLDAAATDSCGAVATLPLLTKDEKRLIVTKWNETDAPFPRACAHELFEEQVHLRPDARAVVLGETSLSYAELNARANQLAHYLIARDVGPDVLVGVCVKRSIDMVVALLAILKSGGAYVPLDPTYPADRLAYMVGDAKPALLLTQESLSGLLPHDGIPVLCMDAKIPGLAEQPCDNPVGRTAPDTLAYVIYTSGSTGKPKGVALEHRGLTNLCIAQGEAFQVDENSQVLQFASISFDAAVSETFVTFAKGACLHLIRQESLRSAYEILSLIDKSEISVVTLPPSLLAVLPKKPLPALKTLVLAGEAWSPELARFWASGRRLLNAYGPTEGTVCATWHEVEPGVEHTVPIGRPLQNVKIYILDKHKQPVPAGVPGELHIAGPNLARGYLHRPELTAERFIENPFCKEHSGRMYRTGDKARYLPDGNIEFLGRIDNQVKLRGYRIELGEIEATLTSHQAVKDAVVMVREDHPGEKRLVAYVISPSEQNVPVFKTHLKTTLPDYMIPQNFVFVEAFPVTPNGKVDRKSLPPIGTIQ